MHNEIAKETSKTPPIVVAYQQEKIPILLLLLLNTKIIDIFDFNIDLLIEYVSLKKIMHEKTLIGKIVSPFIVPQENIY